MKLIQLTQNKQAMVDDEDYEWLNQWKWHYANPGYATREYPKDKSIKMHRIINNTPDGYMTDHIDGDGLNNQKSNLRTATRNQNAANRKINKNNTTGAKGVSKISNGKYRAMISKNNKDISLGCFDTIEQAKKAYDNKAEELFGEFQRITGEGKIK